MATRSESAFSVEDFRAIAARRLPRPVFDVIDGGAGSEGTAAANVAAFDDVKLYHRSLNDVSSIDTSVELFGRTLSYPVFCGPTGLSRLYHPDGELAVARACSAFGTAYAASMGAGFPHADIAKATSGPTILQTYIFKDWQVTEGIIDHGKELGFDALCVTIDTVHLGRRYRDFRSGMVIPPKLTVRSALQFARAPGWVYNYLTGPKLRFASLERHMVGVDESISTFEFLSRQTDTSADWDKLARMIARWGGPVAVKGIVHPAEAARAVECGATSIVVSNHGGRQFDGSLATIEALPAVVDAIGGRAEVIQDGGVRTGEHVLKAIAQGADAVSIGRPYLYALAADGERGVTRLLTLLGDEIRTGMALMGCSSLADVTRDLVFQTEAGPSKAQRGR